MNAMRAITCLVLWAAILSAAAAQQPRVQPPPESFFELVAERDRDVARRFYAKYLDVNGMPVAAHADVADEALKKKVDLTQGLGQVTRMEQDAIPVLTRIRDSKPKDIERYEFVLKTAIDTTRDSLDLNEMDATKRASDVEAREEREKNAIRESMSTEERKSREVE